MSKITQLFTLENMAVSEGGTNTRGSDVNSGDVKSAALALVVDNNLSDDQRDKYTEFVEAENLKNPANLLGVCARWLYDNILKKKAQRGSSSVNPTSATIPFEDSTIKREEA